MKITANGVNHGRNASPFRRRQGRVQIPTARLRSQLSFLTNSRLSPQSYSRNTLFNVNVLAGAQRSCFEMLTPTEVMPGCREAAQGISEMGAAAIPAVNPGTQCPAIILDRRDMSHLKLHM